jgi:hypothetical protein
MVPVYMGEFDDDGTLLDPGDAMLYWVVPILRQPRGDGEFIIKDYVSKHAGTPVPWLTEKRDNK